MDLSLFQGAYPEIEDVQTLLSLSEVTLSHRNIPRIDRLELFSNLQRLDLSHNSIVIIENIRFLSSLVHLDVSYNLIKEIYPSELPKSLQSLQVTGNPLVKDLLHIEGVLILNSSLPISVPGIADPLQDDVCEEESGSSYLDADELLRQIVKRKSRIESLSSSGNVLSKLLNELEESASMGENFITSRSREISNRLRQRMEDHEVGTNQISFDIRNQ